MKRCTKCRVVKPSDDFHRRRRSSDGYSSRCKSCIKEYNRAYYAANAARERARAMERYNANPTASNERGRQWREANHAQHLENNRKWREHNAEYHRARARQWAIDNADRYKDRLRKWRRDNAESIRRKRQEPEQLLRHRERQQRRRAQAGPESPELATLVAELITQPCAYCGDTDNITVDHIVPLSRGGKHEADNLAPACLSCNCSKCDRLLSEWSGR